MKKNALIVAAGKGKRMNADIPKQFLLLNDFPILMHTLNAFAEKGLVNQVAVDPSRMYYDSTTNAHHHFFNIDTGQLYDIPADDLSVENIPSLPENTKIQDLEIVIKIKNK